MSSCPHLLSILFAVLRCSAPKCLCLVCRGGTAEAKNKILAVALVNLELRRRVEVSLGLPVDLTDSSPQCAVGPLPRAGRQRLAAHLWRVLREVTAAQRPRAFGAPVRIRPEQRINAG